LHVDGDTERRAAYIRDEEIVLAPDSDTSVRRECLGNEIREALSGRALASGGDKLVEWVRLREEYCGDE
jgi:hypothetical protein